MLSDKYYNAGTKPFVDISLGLAKKGYNPYLLFFRSASYSDVKNKFPQLQAYIFDSMDKINKFIEKKNIEIVISDDFIYRLKIFKKIKSKHKVIYVQHITGISIMNDLSNKQNIKLRLASYLPWKLVIRNYVRLLRNADVIIGNSLTTTHYLSSLFGISSSGVVYPPVGVDLHLTKVGTRKGILVFKGHKPDFHVRNLESDLKVLREVDEVLIWGEGGLENIRDDDLSRLYSSVKLVYSSTSFELLC